MKYKIKILNEDYVLVNDRKRRIIIRDDGLRKKVFLNNAILKLDDVGDYHQSTKELTLWKNIDDCDKQFFGEIISGKKKTKKTCGWVLQKKYEFKKGRIPEWAYGIIEFLRQKYGLSDVIVRPAINWAMDKKTLLPVIYDFGIVNFAATTQFYKRVKARERCERQKKH